MGYPSSGQRPYKKRASMTELQLRVLRYYKDYGRLNPTFQEVADNVGVKHRQQIQRLVKGLQKKGWITKKSTKKIKINVDV